ncbi:MAG: hypothetical protein M1815_001659 [Lichina confinis]|nr:MAG: hypothetical protein M1815_001659 [Lichina confinis]
MPTKRAISEDTDSRTVSPQFDPRALLNPRQFGQRSPSADGNIQLRNTGGQPLDVARMHSPGIANGLPSHTSSEPAKDDARPFHMSSLIERLHGVSNRDSSSHKRLKLDNSKDGNSMENATASTFSGGAKGGVIGDYMRQKKDEGKQDVASRGTVVDLTGADDDDEVVVVGDSSTAQVCYGRIEGAQVMSHVLPSPSPTAREIDPAFWPVIKVQLARAQLNTHIINVTDPCGVEFGSVSSRIAIGLAAIMDSKNPVFRAQARIPTRRKRPGEVLGLPVSTYYDLNINIYGPKNYASSIGRFLSQKQIWLRTPMGVDAGIETDNPHAKFAATAARVSLSGTSGMGGPGSGYVMRTVEEVRQDVLVVFDSLQDSGKVPEMEPDPRITTPLLPHQKQALHFMTEKEKGQGYDENDSRKRTLWRLRTRNNGLKTYYNVITGKEEQTKPPDVLGGILADMMGLGKTLSILSLVLSTTRASEVWATEKPPRPASAEELPLILNAKTTLLISPLSTIANWEEQIKTHIEPGTVSYYIYHGPNRCGDPERLAEHDIVITTYSVVSSEFDRRSKKIRNGAVSPLQQMHWFRIVLDEAHMIREQSTRQSKAVCALKAQRRWAVTGTPVQNRLDDLGALIKFLRISPFDEKGGFAQFILSPFKNADPEILPKLRLLVDSITLRRLKDRIDLPQRHDRIVRLRFDPAEQALYDLFAKDSDNRMSVVAGGGKSTLAGKAYVHVLRAILRLRLICAHGKDLLGEDDLKILEGASKTNAIDLDDEDEGKPALSIRQAYDMFKLMRETNADVCSQCDRRIAASDATSDDTNGTKDDIVGYMTPCFQLLCRECITSFKESLQRSAQDGQYATCPLCQTYIKAAVAELKQSKIAEDEDSRSLSKAKGKSGKQIGKYGGPHAKTRALLQDLDEWRRESEAHPEEKPIKSVVFSGWTSHLDLIEMALEDNEIQYVRLDGRMSRTERSASLERFRDDATVRVILVSIAAGGLGLNLTSASKVYVMEPQFNPAAEAQAIDRIHRLGQKREVTATRFIMADSFEEKMLELQRKKQNLADLSMNRGKLDKNEATKRRLEDLRSLFK